MKGILYKDFCMIKKYLKVYLFLMLTFGVFGMFGGINSFFTLYPTVLAGIFPSTLISYDESFRFLEYAQTLPVTKRNIVEEKYILGIICIGLAGVFSIVVNTVILIRMSQFSIMTIVHILCLQSFISVCGFSLTAPIIFRFGHERARLVQMLVIGGFTGLVMGFVFNNPIENLFAVEYLPFVIFLLGAVILLISLRLSVRFYEKREL
ncbi:MAG: ABC-2 transporter permease [Anaerofustis stercorihominis]|nr:ABC-2 transporter permease [Anaerofustis stercorihominis]